MRLREPSVAVVPGAVRLIRDCIAVTRLTRLIVADDISEPIRELWLEAAYRGKVAPRGAGPVDTWTEQYHRDPDPPKLATVIMCRWCASVWIAFGVIVVRRTRAWGWLADALVMSEAAALSERLEG